MHSLRSKQNGMERNEAIALAKELGIKLTTWREMSKQAWKKK